MSECEKDFNENGEIVLSGEGDSIYRTSGKSCIYYTNIRSEKSTVGYGNGTFLRTASIIPVYNRS